MKDQRAGQWDGRYVLPCIEARGLQRGREIRPLSALVPETAGPQTNRCQSCEQVDLKKWPTLVKPAYKSKKKYKKHLEEHVEELSELQRLHYASNRYAVLLIFQAMDAAGKDGAIRRHLLDESIAYECARQGKSRYKNPITS